MQISSLFVLGPMVVLFVGGASTLKACAAGGSPPRKLKIVKPGIPSAGREAIDGGMS